MVLEVFLSFMMMPLGDATTLMFSSPLFTAILSAIFLKDARLRLWKVIFITLMMAGMVLVVQPPFIFDSSVIQDASATYFIGAGIAVLCAFTMSVTNVIVRGPLNGLSPTILVFHTGWASLVIAVRMVSAALGEAAVSAVALSTKVTCALRALACNACAIAIASSTPATPPPITHDVKNATSANPMPKRWMKTAPTA